MSEPGALGRGQLPLNSRHPLDGPRAEPHSTHLQGLDTVPGVRTCQCVQPARLMWSLVCKDFGSPFLSHQISASELCPTHQPAALQSERRGLMSVPGAKTIQALQRRSWPARRVLTSSILQMPRVLLRVREQDLQVGSPFLNLIFILSVSTVHLQGST